MSASFIPPALGQSLNEIMLPDVKTTVNLFGMHLRRVDGSWDYPVHEHPQYEINYLLEGEQLMTVNGRGYTQQAGDLMLLRPGDVHSSRSGNGEPFTYFCIHFDIDDKIFLSLLSRMQQVLFANASPVTRRVQPVMSKLIEIAGQPDNKTMAQRMRLQSAIFELFGHLWEAISNEAELIASPAYEKMELAHQIQTQLQALVTQQFKQGVAVEQHYGIDDIASKLGISTSHCNRVFRHVFGLSPRVYLSELVLHEAKLLLANPRLSVQHIASILGYRDIAHFSRQFKRWSGLSPSEYRRANGEFTG
ncbi:AraC family transcriptional regulator [Paenibacillus rigui]|uniref:AraC family transcriptional regulator n=1 Tax=Paenibacillus rigui TaxID=554312 RepID=A0A229USB1_9BACL|nr:AraC family transcriptional regulator [Paenibacillus rigui]OXM86284.1 AraC family transcriptional regulator [Paenibacillus rigui]